MTRAEIKEMMHDVATYSGHVMGFGRLKADHQGILRGTVRTSLGRFEFTITGMLQNKDRWLLHLEDAKGSLENGGICYKPYIVPRFSAHPGLREKIIAANFIIETLTSSQKLYLKDTFREMLRASYRVVEMPAGLSRRDRVGYCLEQIKRKHLPRESYEQN